MYVCLLWISEWVSNVSWHYKKRLGVLDSNVDSASNYQEDKCEKGFKRVAYKLFAFHTPFKENVMSETLRY